MNSSTSSIYVTDPIWGFGRMCGWAADMEEQDEVQRKSIATILSTLRNPREVRMMSSILYWWP